ncbi:hypothetical protein ACQ4PT_006184 [Festuca glaucescens]
MKLLCILPVLLLACVEPAASSLRRYDSIFSFGDSLADTGNDIVVFAANSLVTPAAQPPYGMTFFGRPTGRNSNGRLIIDFIGTFRRGANFAVAGATALDASFFRDIPGVGQFVLNSSSSVQLRWFDSLNKVVIKQGATTVVVPGIPPLGCTPPNLFFFPSADPAGYENSTGCLKDLNEIAVHHNSLLQESLKNVRRNHPNARVIYADFFTPVIQMVESPDKFGLTRDVLRCCCGGGGKYNFNISAGCGMPGATVCQDPSAYLFWDGHLTEEAYRYIAKGWLNSIDNLEF